ncbi:MAG: tetratricopeptide repeat protein [Lysobacterales bacterium]
MSDRVSDQTLLTPAPSLHLVTLTRVGDQLESDRIELHAGQRLGPFELRHLLGAGGMGQVYLADQLHPVQRQVALKFSQLRLGDGEASVRFDIERQALARMSHPAIAHVYETGTTADGFPYLAMEYVPGEPIDDYCRRCQLDLGSRLQLFIRVALGVQHAHQKRILHLDLKPANVLVATVDGVAQPKIIDFGLASSSVRLPGQRSGMAMAGTPGYMSPEQAGVAQDGESVDVDTRSDIYALGVILYQLIADTPPFAIGQFSDLSSAELRQALIGFEPVAVSQRLLELGERARARRVQGDLDAVVACAMHPQRNQRYESVSDLIDDLRSWLENRPVRARAPSSRHRLGLYIRRNRLSLGVAAGLALSLIAGLGAATYGLLQARAERDQVAARQRDLEQVSEFQQSMLAGLDPAVLGQSLRSSLHQQLAAALKSDPAAEERLKAFDQNLNLANPTEAARQLIDDDLLGRALGAIDTELGGQPKVSAELRLAIGKAYLSLGSFDTALEVIDAAVDSLRRELGDSAAKTLQARLSRSEVMRALGRGREDLPALEQLISDARAQGSGATGVMLSAELLRVEVLGLEAGQLAQSVQMARDLLSRHEAYFGVDALETVQSLQVLAALLGRSGDLEDASPLWQRSLDQLQARFGESDPRTISALDALGSNLGMLGEYEQALPIHLKTADWRRRHLGNEHPLTLQSMNGASVSLAKLGRLPEAIALARDVLALRTRTLGADHPLTLRSMLNLGAFLAMNGDISEASRLTRECYERRRRVLGPDNPDVSTAALNQVDFEIIEGHAAEAVKLASEAREQRIRLFGADHPAVLGAEEGLARALTAAERYADALPLLEQQLAELRKPEAGNAGRRSLTAWYLARVYLGLERKAEAQALIDHELDYLRETPWGDLNPPERLAQQQIREYLSK